MLKRFFSGLLAYLGLGRRRAGPAPARRAGPGGPAGRPLGPPRPGGGGAATPDAPNPYAASPEILGLSQEELRRRALRVQPYRTAWIGRVDTIPPASDERTALIDRGLVLRGLLTEEQLAEIHRVGDLWLEHQDTETLARAAGQRRGEEAVEALRRERQERKEQKRREAAERRAARQAAIAARRATDIVYLGRGVSKGLADRRAHVEKLAAAGLPVLASPADVAAALGLPVPRLRWLAFHSEAAERVHYVSFEVPKKTGGLRRLSAPHTDLARAQDWILESLLAKVPAGEAAHGFVRGRSTVTNAAPHVGKAVVVNLDLSDFFPSIAFPRVQGVFRELGYSPAAATCLALLCTEAPRRGATYAGTRYHVALGPRALPQGASTSPALSNLVCRRLDRRLTGLSRREGFTYTRYADDLTFSGGPEATGKVARLLASVRHVAREEGFAVSEKKVRVSRRSGRQEVTGLVVNDRVSVPREERRRLRAILHQARLGRLAPAGATGRPQTEERVRGLAAYVGMVHPERREELARALAAFANGRRARP